MLSYLYAYLATFMQEEEGQGMAEYGLILVGVAVLCAAGFAILGGNIDTMIQGISFTST